MRFIGYSLLLSLPFLSLSAEEKDLIPCSWQSKMRANALKKIDKTFEFLFPYATLLYSVDISMPPQIFYNPFKECHLFAKEHGYFSEETPLVGKVTTSKEDIQKTMQILAFIDQKLTGEHRFHAIGEVLAKVLGYRDLQKNMELLLPAFSLKEEKKLILYQVDQVFNLWGGMPAFGLVPKEKGAASPLLIFRGTDTSLEMTRGWASILSDFDVKGPGFSVFLRIQPELHDWLRKVSLNGKKTQVLGFSLGATLAAYTVLYEKDLVSDNMSEPSMAFSLPGVSLENYNKWNALEKPPAFSVCLSQGDFVARVGYLFGDLHVCWLDAPMRPIEAHNALTSFSPKSYIAPGK